MKIRARSPFLFPGSRRLVYWLWALMLIVHLPALLRDWTALISRGAVEGLSLSFILLNISILVFAAKLHRVRWLEFGHDPRSILSFAVAIALIHINVGQHEGQSPRALEGTQAVAGIFFAVSLAPVQRLLDRLVACRGARRFAPIFLHGALEGLTHPVELRACPSCSPRAPPIRHSHC